MANSKLYELVILFNPNAEEEKIDALMKRIHDLISKSSGELLKSDNWGKKRLAYTIDDLREAIYIYDEFRLPTSVVAEVDRILKISEIVIRHMIVKKPDVLQKAALNAEKEDNQSKEGETDSNEQVQ
ncbi:small subunit ribosomal protein S6 [Thermodesulfobium acidiphilum]|uniref:Small ribosomal subunit protein bS6 n=1 Tax=Thermodesulfobium acidiphilum TaxID=1794699 RepID=A0A2R4VYV3_THEAF|nr:30S ribosomal protein S6 [Thermodesulfobium acidiphilum]AWB09644.1 small subunit ribosomal protein S6 [Thermodesulfobium acidiphilum]